MNDSSVGVVNRTWISVWLYKLLKGPFHISLLHKKAHVSVQTTDFWNPVSLSRDAVSS